MLDVKIDDYIKHVLMTFNIFRSCHVHTLPNCNYCKYHIPRQSHPYKTSSRHMLTWPRV